jgi:hypothetical protein
MRSSECQDTNPATLDQALMENAFAVESRLWGDAVEHVLTYSGALLKVPYNQQLAGSFGIPIQSIGSFPQENRLFRHGGT